MLPLTAAACMQHRDVIAWLLSQGADPSGDRVMFFGARRNSAAVLQLLIDAGGNVNSESDGQPPLFAAVWGMVVGEVSEDSVRVLLAQPCLDVTTEFDGQTPEQYARDNGELAVADMIAQEVGGKG